jgi:hypothetical protein
VAGSQNVGGGGTPAAAGAGGSAGVTEEAGNVTVMGSSLAVPQANYTLTGPRMGVADGDPVVKCTYYPNGLNGRFGPALQILAGYWNWLDSQAQLNIYDVAGAAPFTRQDTYDELLTDQNLLAYASLTNDDELNFYSYWYLYDPFAPLGTVYSTCTTTVMAFTESHVTGATDCMNLPASLLSLDHAPLGDPSPMATVSIEFDCPVTVDDGLPDPGGGGSTCTGSATPCSLLSTFECSSTPGCFSSGDCSGVSSSCYSQFDQFSCSSQDGCYWSTVSDNCSGISSSCSSQFSEFSCGNQEGCSWSEDCSGSATPCSLLTAATCTTQPGCYLQ